MSKTFYFLAGLPRSGSTLLANLLAQNPNLHVSGTSGILGMVVNVRNFWSKVNEFQALEPTVSERRKVATMRGMLEGYYADVEQPVVIDKARGWIQHMEMAEAILGAKPKAIVTVRDVRDVLASFERKWRETKADTQVSQEEGNQTEYQTCEGRCAVLASANQIVGSAVLGIRDAVHRGWRARMHFVEYEDLCASPDRVVAGIYDFLGADGFSHNSKCVTQTINERDEVYGWKKLHEIRGIVQKQEPQWPKYLPESVANKYKPESRFWRDL